MAGQLWPMGPTLGSPALGPSLVAIKVKTDQKHKFSSSLGRRTERPQMTQSCCSLQQSQTPAVSLFHPHQGCLSHPRIMNLMQGLVSCNTSATFIRWWWYIPYTLQVNTVHHWHYKKKLLMLLFILLKNKQKKNSQNIG